MDLQNQTAVDPWRIVSSSASDEDKLRRLRALEYDIRLLQTASDEGMDGPRELPRIREIRAAMAAVARGQGNDKGD